MPAMQESPLRIGVDWGCIGRLRLSRGASGYLNICSGTAKVLFTPKGRYYAGGRSVFSSFVYFWGTQIGILLPRKNELKGGLSDESEDYPF